VAPQGSAVASGPAGSASAAAGGAGGGSGFLGKRLRAVSTFILTKANLLQAVSRPEQYVTVTESPWPSQQVRWAIIKVQPFFWSHYLKPKNPDRALLQYSLGS